MSKRPSFAPFDLVAVTVSSLLMLLYLFVSSTQQPAACASEAPLPQPLRDAAPPADAASADDSIHANNMQSDAPWIREGEPVPNWALYPYNDDPAHWAPEPDLPGKKQSWHNKMLFPSTRCPYCGRRVPTKKGSYLFLVIGLIGQVGFSLRFLVQWVASEKAKASVIPESFWWLSIFGSLLLLVWAISALAWPIILGQSPNILIYARNLYFIHKHKQPTLSPSDITKPE